MDYPVSIPIKKIIQETDDVRTFVFEYQLGAKPGQFVMLWLPGVDAKPFSVAYDDGQEFWITFFAVGPMTKQLATKKVGDLVGVIGPYGTNYQYQAGENLALVAGGYGAAPMYFVAQEAAEKNCKIDFIVGARSEKHLLFLELIEQLPNTTLHVATDDGSRGHQGYNTEVLEKILDAQPMDWLFSCGPEMMMKRVCDIGAERDVEVQISMERYMKCGFGVCGNCCVDGLGIPLCKKGVVISGKTANSIPEFGKYHRDSLGQKHYF